MNLYITDDTTQPSQLIKSQRYFNQVTLFFYDFILYGFISKYAWGCPTETLDAHYANHITANHLDVGVGTGYLLDRLTFPSARPRLALMDLSKSCLTKTLNRLARYNPEIYEQNILEPITMGVNKFDSIGINSVMHCIPGSFKEKGVAFQHLKSLLNDNGVLFGTTVLSKGVTKNWLSRTFMNFFNSIGVFINTADSLDDLTESLKKYFPHVDIAVEGSTAIFAAR
jgi:2-polyprenyl-3-methyl-5-hydroxy-6-metoxy-1,4-benzoquinol methylase